MHAVVVAVAPVTCTFPHQEHVLEWGCAVQHSMILHKHVENDSALGQKYAATAGR